jgi:hypothetical protein
MLPFCLRAFCPLALLTVLAAMPASSAEDAPITRKDLLISTNNLKQIVLAYHNFASTYNSMFPGDILDKTGKPLLSWRVAILPYIEEVELYKQFKLDEPWDSDNNKKLIEKMPKIYAPVRVKAPAGETYYQTFKGPGTIFTPNSEGGYAPKYNIGNIPDGTSNTGLVFEAGEPVVWSKPADMLLDAKKDVPKLGGLFDGVCNVGMADGSVLRLKKNPDQAELKNLICPDDGNVLDLDKLKK